MFKIPVVQGWRLIFGGFAAEDGNDNENELCE